MSVTTLKRLTFCWEERGENPKSVSIDTPNLVYLKFTDTIADKYPKVNFDSLVEAHIDLRMSVDQMGLTHFKEEASFEDLQKHYSEGYGENDLVGNATDFIIGICNVKILYLSADTLQVCISSFFWSFRFMLLRRRLKRCSLFDIAFGFELVIAIK